MDEKMKPVMLYDVILEFETELFVNVFDDSFEEMMVSLTGRKSGVGTYCTAKHNMSITDTPVIPDDEMIEACRKLIFEEVSKAFSEKSDTEVRGTKFIGITSVKQKRKEIKMAEKMNDKDIIKAL